MIAPSPGRPSQSHPRPQLRLVLLRSHPQENVRWQARHLGRCAIVKDGKLALIYHTEDSSNGFHGARGTFGTFRQGLAWSDDGLHFKTESQPVLYPDNGPSKTPSGRGDEIPRIVEARQDLLPLLQRLEPHRYRSPSPPAKTSSTGQAWPHFAKPTTGNTASSGAKPASRHRTQRQRLQAVKSTANLDVLRRRRHAHRHFRQSHRLDPLEIAPVKPTHPRRRAQYGHDQDSRSPRRQFPRVHKFDSELVESVSPSHHQGIVHIYNSSDTTHGAPTGRSSPSCTTRSASLMTPTIQPNSSTAPMPPSSSPTAISKSSAQPSRRLSHRIAGITASG